MKWLGVLVVVLVVGGLARAGWSAWKRGPGGFVMRTPRTSDR